MAKRDPATIGNKMMTTLRAVRAICDNALKDEPSLIQLYGAVQAVHALSAEIAPEVTSDLVAYAREKHR